MKATKAQREEISRRETIAFKAALEREAESMERWLFGPEELKALAELKYCDEMKMLLKSIGVTP